MTTPLVSERVRVRRRSRRAAYQREALFDVLDAGIVCHVGFLQGESPVVIPTLYWRDEAFVYFHGSVASRMLDNAVDREICLTVTHLDGLVLTRSAFHHSANYRSAMIFGRPVAIGRESERRRHLRRMMDALFPGRWETLRPVTRKELRATNILALPMEQFSVKSRHGPASEDEADLTWPTWAGVLPVFECVGTAIPDADTAGSPYAEPALDRFERSPARSTS